MMAIAALALAWMAAIFTAVAVLRNASGHASSDVMLYLTLPLWAATAVLAGIPQGLLSPWWPVALLMLVGASVVARDCVADITAWRDRRRRAAIVLGFPKHTGNKPIIPGKWKRGRIDSVPVARIVCSTCRGMTSVREAEIKADGLLRFRCSNCSFDRRIRLAQWRPE